jgi:hypothetical protein
MDCPKPEARCLTPDARTTPAFLFSRDQSNYNGSAIQPKRRTTL